MAEGTEVTGKSGQDATFLRHRRLVFSLAYDITGSVSDAEDVTQACYERWRRASEVHDARAWLARVATNLAIDTVRGRSRVAYVGPWLPEPIPAYAAAGPSAEELELRAEEVSVALLVVLQSLSSLERAAFLLVEVFGFSAPEAADILGRTPAAVRQLVSRSRRHVKDADPRRTVDAAEHRRTVERFVAAASTGDAAALAALLGEQVVLTSDGGGLVSTALRPVVGRDNVLRFLAGLATRFTGRFALRPELLNGEPGWLLMLDGAVDHAAMVVVEGGEITKIFLQRNPTKLAHLG